MLSIRVRHLLCLLLFAVSGSHSSAFALSPPEALPDRSAPSSAQTHLTYDQVSARVPRALAPIASVVVARVNIAMHHARQRAEQTLCAGRWTPQGSILFEVGPLVTESTDADDGNDAWTYQAYRHPEVLSCGDISRTHFFQELSRYLPDWIMIRPGGQPTAFRQGMPVASN